MKRVLITGANGLLGQRLVQIFSSFELFACDLTSDFFLPIDIPYGRLNISNKDQVVGLVESFKPGWIVNCAGYTDVDRCEEQKELAWSVNVDGAENLAWTCKKFKINLVHFSTDYVFDGENGPYDEEGKTNPISFYGKTKLESEKVVRGYNINHTIIRTNVLYDFGHKVKTNFFIWVLEKLKKGEEIEVVTDQYNNPTLAFNLAGIVKEAIEENIFGLYHIGGKDYLSRHEFAQKIARVFGLDKEKIKAVKTAELKQAAPRPSRGGLRIDRAKGVFKTEIWGVEKSLEFLKKNRSSQNL